MPLPTRLPQYCDPSWTFHFLGAPSHLLNYLCLAACQSDGDAKRLTYHAEYTYFYFKNQVYKNVRLQIVKNLRTC